MGIISALLDFFVEVCKIGLLGEIVSIFLQPKGVFEYILLFCKLTLFVTGFIVTAGIAVLKKLLDIVIASVDFIKSLMAFFDFSGTVAQLTNAEKNKIVENVQVSNSQDFIDKSRNGIYIKHKDSERYLSINGQVLDNDWRWLRFSKEDPGSSVMVSFYAEQISNSEYFYLYMIQGTKKYYVIRNGADIDGYEELFISSPEYYESGNLKKYFKTKFKILSKNDSIYLEEFKYVEGQKTFVLCGESGNGSVAFTGNWIAYKEKNKIMPLSFVKLLK